MLSTLRYICKTVMLYAGVTQIFLASAFVDSVYFTVSMICVNLCKILILNKTDLTGTFYML